GYRGGEDHPPIAGLAHDGKGGAGGEKAAFEIDRQHTVPFLRADVLDHGPGVDAGILHDDVESFKIAERARHDRLRIAHLRDVDAEEAGTARAAEPFRRCGALRFRIADDDAAAFAHEILRDRGADAAGGTDHDGDLAFEPV